jgi:uncharacterized protein (TIGR03083 family)
MTVPIETIDLFPELDRRLIELLRSLSTADWNKQTLARQWTVKDTAAHLLDGNIRSVSMIGDGYQGESPGQINSYRDLVDYLNRLNADWVKAMKRVSPAQLISLLEITGKSYYECIKALPPFGKALFTVDWAGEEHSQNWFHIAREFTEKWHHQQQIREAVNKPGNMETKFFSPLIRTFMQALPHTYRNIVAPEKSSIHVRVGDDQWNLAFIDGKWKFEDAAGLASTTVEIEPDIAWKLFTKGVTHDQAGQKIIIKGDRNLAVPILGMVAVMA